MVYFDGIYLDGNIEYRTKFRRRNCIHENEIYIYKRVKSVKCQHIVVMMQTKFMIKSYK